jgi:hypothetical protein
MWENASLPCFEGLISLKGLGKLYKKILSEDNLFTGRDSNK